MEHTEAQIEKRIQEGGTTRTRLSPDKIDAVIAGCEFFVFSNKTTVCCMTLKNGFTVVGSAACVDPANFRADIGRDVAYTKARDQIWQLEGYLLQQRFWDEELTRNGG